MNNFVQTIIIQGFFYTTIFFLFLNYLFDTIISYNYDNKHFLSRVMFISLGKIVFHQQQEIDTERESYVKNVTWIMWTRIIYKHLGKT